jgi:hypothetical protein
MEIIKGIEVLEDKMVIDLKTWSDVAEEIYDVLVSAKRDREPVVSWEGLKTEMNESRA